MDAILSSGVISITKPDGTTYTIGTGEITRTNVVKRPVFSVGDDGYEQGDPDFFLMIHLSDQSAERLKVVDLRTSTDDGATWDTYTNVLADANAAKGAIDAVIPYFDAIVDTGE
jgi:hypothetical protein